MVVRVRPIATGRKHLAVGIVAVGASGRLSLRPQVLGQTGDVAAPVQVVPVCLDCGAFGKYKSHMHLSPVWRPFITQVDLLTALPMYFAHFPGCIIVD